MGDIKRDICSDISGTGGKENWEENEARRGKIVAGLI
jgi:hypothetical protein